MHARTPPFAQLGNDAVLNLNTNHQSTGFPVSKSGVGASPSAAWAGPRCGDKIVTQMMTIAQPRVLGDLFCALFMFTSGPMLSLLLPSYASTKGAYVKQVTRTEVFAALPYRASVAAHLQASNWSGRRCLRRGVAAAAGPLLKIFVDDLCQANSCLQQLLLHDRQRVLDVDAGVFAQIDATWKAQLNIENIFNKGYWASADGTTTSRRANRGPSASRSPPSCEARASVYS